MDNYSVKPALKKVSKYDNKFKASTKKSEDKADFRSNLKIVKKDNVQAILEVKVVFSLRFGQCIIS